MRLEDFWLDDQFAPDGALRFNLVLVRQLRAAPLRDLPDVEAGIALARLLHQEFERYGTDSSQQISDTDARESMRTMVAVTTRLGVTFDPPYRDFGGFRAYWTSHGGYGSWAARRSMVQDLFGPVQETLERLEDDALGAELAEPIASERRSSWPDVDDEISELRRHFHAATTTQDFRNVGNDVVAVLETLSSAAYNATRHLREGEAEPSVAQTKNRLSRIVEVDCAEEGSDELVRLAKATVELAQAVKHNPSGSRTRAGIAADAAILLANMIRRLQEPD